ncbi:GAP family protein [Nonomuraea candida]|uniref:GAP family protein n=1 Tax=Nonomuraea candida TaxID=359159 RepID=UPI0005B8E8F3|nr:GAP family protein [Nonomuraea candida]
MTDILIEVLPLALLDTLSVSTIAIPVWFLLMPRGLRIGYVFGYLFFVAIGYLFLGLLLLTVFSAVHDELRSALNSPAGDQAMSVAGVILLLIAVWYGLLRRERRGSGRLGRWREIAVGESATPRGLVIVAALAVLIEVATMFPYLAAIGRLGRSDLPWHLQAAVLAVYCLVMIAPAFVVTVARFIAKNLVRSPLRRLDGWLKRNARENTAWLIALAGFMLLSNTTLYDRIMNFVSSMT